MSVFQKIRQTWSRDGSVGIGIRTVVYLLRRISWRTDAISRRLDYSVNKRSTLNRSGALLSRNEIFRNLHKGKRCFVIGNGPSLKVQDLGPLRDEITFVTNSFYLHPIVSRSWQPGYYCLSDPVYFNGTVPIAEFRAITERIDSAPFFVPHSAHDFIIQHQALPESRTYYFAGADFIHDSSVSAVDLTTVTIGVQTVVQLAIVAAIFMGCSEIYLLGMDHDWLSHGGSHLNFYSQQDASSQPAGNLEGWTYRSMMEAVTTMWKIYEQLGHIAESQGIKIINATRGGFLDVFARETYEPIVGLADPAETDVLPRK